MKSEELRDKGAAHSNIFGTDMNSIIEKKAFAFSKRIVKLRKHLTEKKKEYIVSRQIARSGTSIGANVTEAQNAQSNKDFISKMQIALKETRETKYWLKLLFETDYLNQKEFNSLYNDCDELYKIIASIVMTMKEKDSKNVAAKKENGAD